MHVAGAVGRDIFAEGVQILAAAFAVAFDAAFNARKNFGQVRESDSTEG